MESILSILALCLAVFFSTILILDKEVKDNSEFEAKNCPAMLQVDSEYCKPRESE